MLENNNNISFDEDSLDNKNESNKLRFIDKIDNFLDNHFSLLLAIGIPICILNVFLMLFWVLIYYS